MQDIRTQAHDYCDACLNFRPLIWRQIRVMPRFPLRGIKMVCLVLERQPDDGIGVEAEPLAGDAKARSDQVSELAPAAHAHLELRFVVLAASDLADIGENISMEEVLGPGTHKKPVANEDADAPKVESQTV